MSGKAKVIRKHHDPHSHHVHKPGRRLMHKVSLAFVLNKVMGHGGRSPNAALNLTSYIDFLLVTVIFLLMSFSASGEIAVDKSITLPSAENVEEVIEAPMVAVNLQSVMVDGSPAGNTRSIRDAGKVQKVEELFELLKRKKELWSSFHPDKQFPGVAILQVDSDVEALVVKSVFQTAAFAGYPNISFMVRKRGKVGGGEAGGE